MPPAALEAQRRREKMSSGSRRWNPLSLTVFDCPQESRQKVLNKIPATCSPHRPALRSHSRTEGTQESREISRCRRTLRCCPCAYGRSGPPGPPSCPGPGLSGLGTDAPLPPWSRNRRAHAAEHALGVRNLCWQRPRLRALGEPHAVQWLTRDSPGAQTVCGKATRSRGTPFWRRPGAPSR